MMRMLLGGMSLVMLLGSLSVTLGSGTADSDGLEPVIDDGAAPAPIDGSALATDRFLARFPGVALYENAGRIRRVYGRSFSHGETADASVARFIDVHSEMFGISAGDLVARGPFHGNPDRHVQPILYLPDEERYRFTGTYFQQEIDGVPVFNARAVFLTRNEPGNPLVLISSDLRNLGGFRVDAQQRVAADAGAGRARQIISADLGVAPVWVGESESVVWAGLDEMNVEPRLAVKQIAQVGTIADGDAYEKWLYLVDALDGNILHRESLVLNSGSTISGSVSLMATEGNAAAMCSDPALFSMPYARLSIGSGPGQVVAYADVSGDFQILPQTLPPIQLASGLRGQYFRVFNQAGPNTVLTEQVDVLPQLGLNLLHDSAPFPGGDGEEYYLAEIDAYLHANVVRDFTLGVNPEYPVIGGETQFPVNVNIDDDCNAFYDYQSINFFRAAGGCANTAFSTVVYHEYGHHLVASGGSGQGAYGEGMSDSIAVLITDSPFLGIGFGGNCFSALRSADNMLQYPCSGSSHSCGRLISGCIWSTRNALQAAHPSTYRDILSNLTVNSILLHTGTSIDPSITIDFLTLDDDDDLLLNGTPHYEQINAGFAAHNMAAPPLPALYFSLPEGLPDILPPGETVVIRVEVSDVTSSAVPGAASMHYRFHPSEIFATTSMVEVAPNVYDAQITAPACDARPEFFFSASDVNEDVTMSEMYTVPAGTSIELVVEEVFQSSAGWIGNAPGDDAANGHWEWGDPIGTTSSGQQAQPGDCFIGDFCWFTGQHGFGGAGANDVDEGTTTLRSPIYNLEDFADARISYQRWYSNHAGANPHVDTFVVDVSGDGGITWHNVEVVGPAGPETTGGWYRHEFRLSDIIPPTNRVRLRFVASDLGPQALVEAAIDHVVIEGIHCVPSEPAVCPADLDQSGDVGVPDLLALLSAWGTCGDCVEDLNNDGTIGVADLLDLLAAWGPCKE